MRYVLISAAISLIFARSSMRKTGDAVRTANIVHSRLITIQMSNRIRYLIQRLSLMKLNMMIRVVCSAMESLHPEGI